METVTLPVWALALAVGLPGICLTWIITALIRRRRRAGHAMIEKQADNQAFQSSGPSQFNQDLLALQIEIVFNGLVALIETERIKLNALLNQTMSPESHIQTVAPMDENFMTQEPDFSRTVGTVSRVGQQVAEAMESGQGVDGVATQLGLSHAEVELAMKLDPLRSATSRRKLEAVA